VDAASGAFIAPFLHPSVVWDFRLPRVQSVNVSGHKFGLAPRGCGWAIWREARDFPEGTDFQGEISGWQHATFALNFSLPGGLLTAKQPDKHRGPSDQRNPDA
jgi:glutamate decarboxylase